MMINSLRVTFETTTGNKHDSDYIDFYVGEQGQPPFVTDRIVSKCEWPNPSTQGPFGIWLQRQRESEGLYIGFHKTGTNGWTTAVTVTGYNVSAGGEMTSRVLIPSTGIYFPPTEGHEAPEIRLNLPR
jgi:hypothetical protein